MRCITTLSFHIKSVHENSKKHQCDICDTEFILKGNLLKHFQSTHHDFATKEVLKCDICSKSFFLKTNLLTHVKNVHEKIKNQKCNFCEESFSDKKKLKQHLKQVHLDLI